MFDYRKKPVRVEAVQWQKGLKEVYMPYWLLGALDLTNNHLYGRIRRVGDALQVDGKIAREGNWIVYYLTTTQELEVYDASEFEKLFEVDEGRRARLRRWSENETKNKKRKTAENV